MNLQTLTNEQLMAELKRREEEEIKTKSALPKTLTLYAHSNDCGDYNNAIEAGFTEEQIGKFGLDRLLYEVAFTFRVQEDGKVFLTHLNNYELSEPQKWN